MSLAQKRSASSADLAGAPTGKRSAGPTVGGLQRELQQERERHERLHESVEQLRLELQMMGRLLATAREQLVASGATAVEPGVVLRTPPAPSTSGQRTGRTKADAKLIQRLTAELAESKAQCRRLSQVAEQQQQKMQVVSSSKKELLAILSEMNSFMNSSR